MKKFIGLFILILAFVAFLRMHPAGCSGAGHYYPPNHSSHYYSKRGINRYTDIRPNHCCDNAASYDKKNRVTYR